MFQAYGNKKTILHNTGLMTLALTLFKDRYIISSSKEIWGVYSTLLEVWDMIENICIRAMQVESDINSILVLSDDNIATLSHCSIDIWKFNKEVFKLVKTINAIKNYSVESGAGLVLLNVGHLAWATNLIHRNKKTRSGHIFIIHCKNYSLVKSIKAHSGPIASLINLSESMLATAYSNKIKIWKINKESNEKVKELVWEENKICHLAFSRNRNILISTCLNDICLWSMLNYQNIKTVKFYSRITHSLILSYDYIAFGNNYGNIFLYDLLNDKHVKSLNCQEKDLFSMVLWKDSILLTKSLGNLVLWE
jgi:WD40 repeat protein